MPSSGVRRKCWTPGVTHQEALINRMRLDHAGYVAAIQWSATTPSEEEAGLRLLARLRYHWLSGGLLAEGRMRIEALLAKATEPTLARADCVWVMTWISLLQGDHEKARECLDELATLAAALGEPRLGAHVHHWRALLALFIGDVSSAIRGFEMAVDEHRAWGDHFLELTARYMLATGLLYAAGNREALETSTSTVAMCERYGDQSARVYALWAGAVAQWRLGHLDEAEQSARAVLRVQRALSDGICVALTTHLLACVAHDRRQADRAAMLSLAARRVWRSLGSSLEAFGPQLAEFMQWHSPQPQSSAQESVPVSGPFADLQAVIALGLGIEHGPTRAHGMTQELTKRELEVAALIENGLSNREIAQRLVIAKRTADGHVERILSKLGFTSRAQIAAWMARREKTHL
jgi:ATP/maltotriose-dependent transcriptional regulator MalT